MSYILHLAKNSEQSLLEKAADDDELDDGEDEDDCGEDELEDICECIHTSANRPMSI